VKSAKSLDYSVICFNATPNEAIGLQFNYWPLVAVYISTRTLLSPI
jgi:hypothetical protein